MKYRQWAGSVQATCAAITALLLTASLDASAHSGGQLPIAPFPKEARAAGAGNNAGFVNFETPHVHPIDISPDGLWLAACNTPDGRIEIYSINQTTGALVLSRSVTVGVDPVSIRFRTNDELWAVNAVSDSISIIDRTIGQVSNTIITYRLADTGSQLEGQPNGDRPMDVVFINAGALAVVSCTRTDVLQLYDAATRALLNESLVVKGEEPRALATDGTAVWVGIFESGNGTTSITGLSGGNIGNQGFPPSTAIQSASNPYGGPQDSTRGQGEYFSDGPPANGSGWNVNGVAIFPPLSPSVPPADTIVRSDGAGQWLDDNGRDWASFVDGANASLSGRITGWVLLDNDIGRITQSSNTLSEDASFGTSGYVRRQMNIVMAIARNPVDGSIVSVGTDARNEIRFEPNVNGIFTRVMVSIVNGTTGAQIALKDLNAEHLDLANGGSGNGALAYVNHSVAQSERNKSIGDPRGIAFTPNGAVAYISGMGSNNLVAINATGGSAGNRISTGYTINVPQGPTGLAHHGTLNRLYVLSKFASQIRVLNTTTPGSETTVQTVNIFDPTPAPIKAGRPVLYDTHLHSGLGQIACGSCHVDARMDRLGWNLGNPAGGPPTFAQGTEKPVHGLGDGLITGSGTNPPDTHNTLFVPEVSAESDFGTFSSVKGVMTTQTLQDIIGKEPFHWRGDRDGIEEFAGAFQGLNGGDAPLDGVSMQQFEDFLASIYFEPNPFRPLDNALPGGPPLSSAYTGNHKNVAIPGHLSPGTTTSTGGNPKNNFSALGTQLPAGNAFAGFNDYVDNNEDSVFSCVVCHTLPIGTGSTSLINLTSGAVPPTFSATPIPPTDSGSSHVGIVAIDGTGQNQIKVAYLRNQIEKEGMYLNFPGVPSRAGFGVLHDGVIDGISRFIAEPAFKVNTDQGLADLVAFVLCIRGNDFARLQGLSGAPTGGIPPAAIDQSAHAAVGAQAILPPGGSDFYASVLLDVAGDGDIDLVAETRINGQRRRYTLFDNTGTPRYISDRAADGLVTETALETATDGGFNVLLTGLQKTTGKRIGVDRDEDGCFDGDEAALGTDEANSADNAFVGSAIPPLIGALHTTTTFPSALGMVTASAGKRAAIHLQGGNYSGAITINQPVALRKMVDPNTGAGVGGDVFIGTP